MGERPAPTARSPVLRTEEGGEIGSLPIETGRLGHFEHAIWDMTVLAIQAIGGLERLGRGGFVAEFPEHATVDVHRQRVVGTVAFGFFQVGQGEA